MSTLWGVPVFQETSNLTLSNFTSKEYNFLEKLRRDNSLTVNDTTTELIMSGGKLLENKELRRIKNHIHLNALKYASEVICLKQDIVLSASWFTVNRRGSSHSVHKHQHSLFSVCYYPQVESGQLLLMSENSKNIFQRDYHFGLSYTKQNEYNSNHWLIPVTSGDMVIFPSWVNHGSTSNESDTDRWMIGANYWIQGEVSQFDCLDRINL